MNTPSQSTLPMIGEIRQQHMADAEVIAKLPTCRAAMRYAVNMSGIDQEGIAGSLGIDAASFSRMLKDPKYSHARPRNLPLDRLADFCRITGSLAPIQWLNAQLGLEPVAIRETRMHRLERELELERRRVGIAA